MPQPLVINSALAGFTVEYNGVQFGGSDSAYKSYPPFYQLTCAPRYSDSGRSILWLDCTLQVRCIFYETTEVLMAVNMRAVRAALEQTGRLLTISGLGSGFDHVQTAAGGLDGDVIDIANGPKPGPIVMNVIGGQLAWELNWSVQFSFSPCVTQSTDRLAFVAFEFATTWRNDFEGLTQRTISGHVMIPQARNYVTPKTIQAIADETRGNIVVSTPSGFKRTENVWSETEDKQRLNFSIVDEQLQGDAPPPGVTIGSGNFAFVSGGENNVSMARSICTLSMSLKTAYDQPRDLAGRVFMIAALSKQVELSAIVGGNPTITVVPLHLSISNGKLDGARVTQCSMSWAITKDLNTCLTAANIWSPLSANLTAMGGSQDYTAWKASMSSLWDNRGSTQQSGSVSEAVIIDICDNVTTKTIGAVGSNPNVTTPSSLPSLTCPTVSSTGGWLHFDLDVKVHREDNSTQHRRAALFNPNIGSIYGYGYDQQPDNSGNAIAQGGSSYSQDPSDQTITEHHGFPEFTIGLTFSGLRYVNKPFVPEIKSVGGVPVRLKSQKIETPTHAFDALGCPVWRVSGYRIYTVPGYIGSVKPVTSLVATDTNVPLEL